MAKRIWFFSTLFFCLLFVACSSQSNGGTDSNRVPTLSSSPSLTLKIFPTVTPEKTSTVAPSIQVTTTRLAKTKTPTFLPTMLPSLAQDQIVELIKSNGDCELPCWWGIKPGETRYQEINKLLSPLTIRQPYIAGDVSQHALLEYFFPIPETLSFLGRREVDLRIIYEQSKLIYIEVIGLQWHEYSLSELLSKYGPPDEVIVHTFQWVPGSAPPFALFLFYSEKGILAYFPSLVEKNEVQVTESTIRGCLSVSADLSLWSPKNSWTLDEAVKHMTVPILEQEDKPRLSIYEATGMSVFEFYETYKNSTVTPCIDTPKNLWPVP